jgi:hypothetical protein
MPRMHSGRSTEKRPKAGRYGPLPTFRWFRGPTKYWNYAWKSYLLDGHGVVDHDQPHLQTQPWARNKAKWVRWLVLFCVPMASLCEELALPTRLRGWLYRGLRYVTRCKTFSVFLA